jgi:hypothetical protein
MSTFDFTPDPRQGLRSPLGTLPGTPGPLAAPATDEAAPLDLAGPPAAATELLPPPPGPGDEIGLLKAMLVTARDYTDLPTVEESERLEMEKVTTILQKLLADNQRMADSATGFAAYTEAARRAASPAPFGFGPF